MHNLSKISPSLGACDLGPSDLGLLRVRHKSTLGLRMCDEIREL